MTKTILITGGCGFIGTSLISKLVSSHSNLNIRILDNLSASSLDSLASITQNQFHVLSPETCCSTNGISFIKGDIRDAVVALLCSRQADCIVHLAANTGVGPSVENPRLDMECNVVGTLNMLEAARLNNVKRFIFASSGAPAGEVEPPIHEELPPHPVSPYGASKLAGEGYCSAYFRTFGVHTVCLRFGNVYGPRSQRKTSVVAKFIRQALQGEVCEIFGDGTQTRDFIYIDDLIRAILLGIDTEVGGETFQIATGIEHTVAEISSIIADVLQGHGIRMTIKHTQARLGDVKRNFSDTRKAKKMLAWEAETDLYEGIKRTVDYFLAIEEQR